jgi:hypothetical protein
MDKSQIGLAGEFYTLAALTHRGYVATLTLGNTKGVDILVTNQEINRLFKVEVKTTSLKLRKERLFGQSLFYIWAMSLKHEKIADANLVYCFVALGGPEERPRFFLVPSLEVSAYVTWQHQHWLDTRKNPVKDTTMRNFRIEEDDPKNYQDNWGIFGG